MGQFIDISGKITNELPCIKITPELIVTVNNRKSTVLNIQAMVQEAERKKKQVSDEEFMKKAMEMLVGKKNAEAIEAMDLPIPEYKELYQTMMDVATGNYGNTPSKE